MAPETIAPAKDPADAHMKRMMYAIKSGSYEDFAAAGTPEFKAGGRTPFGVASAHFAPMLVKGYKTTYLCRLHKTDHAISLWKLEPAGAPEDYLIKVVMRGGKVSGFWID
jgi:hypothetical protein